MLLRNGSKKEKTFLGKCVIEAHISWFFLMFFWGLSNQIIPSDCSLFITGCKSRGPWLFCGTRGGKAHLPRFITAVLAETSDGDVLQVCV